jgi:hypothetical protein
VYSIDSYGGGKYRGKLISYSDHNTIVSLAYPSNAVIKIAGLGCVLNKSNKSGKCKYKELGNDQNNKD